jgi:hypothetical protein
MLQAEIEFYGVQRSGNHAIIFWFLNNIGGCDKHLYNKIYWNDDTHVYYYNHVNRRDLHHDTHFAKEFNFRIKSYESIEFKPSKTSFLIVRDILNTLTSQHKHQVTFRNPKKVINTWKQHIKHFNKDKPFDNNVIMYNYWLIDKNYRDRASKMLGVSNIVDNTKYVSNIGNGSSFIKRNKESDIRNYTTRYSQHTLPDNVQELLLQDDEIIHINKHLFDIDIQKILKPS